MSMKEKELIHICIFDTIIKRLHVHIGAVEGEWSIVGGIVSILFSVGHSVTHAQKRKRVQHIEQKE